MGARGVDGPVQLAERLRGPVAAAGAVGEKVWPASQRGFRNVIGRDKSPALLRINAIGYEAAGAISARLDNGGERG